MKRSPTNPELWDRVLKLTRGDVSYITVDGERYNGPRDGKGFKKHPSAYSNSWACKLYKQLGGGWRDVRMSMERVAARVAGLDKWHKEKWVAIDTQGNIVGDCAQSDKRPKETRGGQDPIKCLPMAKAQSMTKEQRALAANRKKRTERESPNTKEPVHAKT